MNNQPAILTKGLSKTFGEIQAVKDVSFQVNTGEIFSLLGPNGAGKTTILRMLSCLTQPNAGDAWMKTTGPQKGNEHEHQFFNPTTRLE